MRKMRKISYALAVLCATACIYPFEPELGEAPKGVLVVDGNISIGSTSYIRLGTMYSLFSSGYEGSGVYADEDGNV